MPRESTSTPNDCVLCALEQMVEDLGKRLQGDHLLSDAAYMSLRSPSDLSVEQVRDLYRRYWSARGRAAARGAELAGLRDLLARYEHLGRDTRSD
jgi:hypothetical protein